jgi:hypothetical protein
MMMKVITLIRLIKYLIIKNQKTEFRGRLIGEYIEKINNLNYLTSLNLK